MGTEVHNYFPYASLLRTSYLVLTSACRLHVTISGKASHKHPFWKFLLLKVVDGATVWNSLTYVLQSKLWDFCLTKHAIAKFVWRRMTINMKHWGNYTDRGNWHTVKKTCPRATRFSKNPTRIVMGFNPGLRGERPATDRLRHGRPYRKKGRSLYVCTTTRQQTKNKVN